MRRVHGLVGAVSIVVGVWVAAASGCVFSPGYDDCNQYPHPGCGTGTGASSSTTTSSSSTGTGGMENNCVPSESADPVADSCGVFVSSSVGSDDTAADRGTQGKPFKTISAALKKTGVARVYACAETFTEAVAITSAVNLYGGLDCKSWAYVGATKKTTLTALANTVPLMLAGDATIEDFAVTAVDATKDGGSSIAVIADHAMASFVHCDLVAGSGKAGLPGTTPTDPTGATDSNDVTIKGNDGAMACANMAVNIGGLPKENDLCPSATGGPVGGIGGNGLVATGSNGDANPATSQTALGGKGQPTADPLWSCAGGSGLGNGGANGATGADGTGATGVSSLGTLDKSGYAGTPGQPGGLAPPGQGGGGGGGAKGKLSCAGASGGGGGAGGCGGKGGLGGNAGGASIALMSLGATLVFDKVTIKVGVGGDGGSGGDGQGGGKGGNGGNGGSGDVAAPATLDACNGGKGGQGGTGGKGGGGRGGHAIGIAYTGAMPPLIKGATFTPGKPGKGGVGAADMMHDGDPGVLADVQVFQ